MKDSIHINGIACGATRIMEEIMNGPPRWKMEGLEFLIQMLDPSDAPVKFHTSGTTGTPREITFTKKQILYSAGNTCRFFELNSNDQLLLCLPAEFVAGRLMMARAFVSGADLIWVEPSLNPLSHFNGKIDFAAFTPAQVISIIKDPVSRERFSQIKKLIIGGGEINYSLEQELKGFSSTMYATYGMTETLTHIAVRKIGEEEYHSVYPDANFSTNEEECLVIDLPFISKTKMITTDVIELIDPQTFKWKGRKDHVINSGGLKIYPEQIESSLIIDGILKEGDFYISSQANEQFGESPVIVLLKHRAPDSVAAFLERINGLLNKHQEVKAVFIFDKFEYTDNGKLKRQKFK